MPELENVRGGTMQNIRILLLSTIIILTSAKAAAAPQCAGDMAQFNNSPELKRVVALFGGPDNLNGTWKLSGLAGSFVSARVKFENRGNSFWTQMNNEAPAQIDVCTNDADRESIVLVVRNPIVPENKYGYVKPVPGAPNRIQLAGHATKFKFYKFKKVETIQASAGQ
jgi:hypothetical protein